MPLTVEDLTRDGTSDLDALDKVRRAESLLAEIAPVHARWVERFVRSFTVMDLRSNPFLVTQRGILFGAERLAKSSSGSLALILVNAAVSCRLKRFDRRLRSADQRAQYWRRMRKEVVAVARRLDEHEDPGGYIAGVSVGRWEPWAEGWLHGAERWRAPRILAFYRDIRRLGLPRWMARLSAAYWAWRWRAGS